MPSPESRSAFPQSEVVERKTTEERFDTVPTHIRGVSLRIEPGVELDIPKEIIEALYKTVREHAARYFEIKSLESEQKPSDQEIKTSAQTHEGLRGVQSEEEDFDLIVFPRKTVSFDPQLLKQSAGIIYSTVVHEDLGVSILIPTGFQTEKGPISEDILRQALSQALVNLGLSEEDLTKIMEIQVRQRVEKKILEEKIATGKITLLPGTEKIEQTWAIVVKRLNKSPKN